MHTILIMPKKTADSMQEHYPALREVIEGSDMGICSWNPSATTVETALPQLNELIDNKREWRAVVVMYDESMFDGSDPVNPFDFNSIDKLEQGKSRISLETSHKNDLIRLTHFLVGAPVPAPEYEQKVFDSEVEEGDSSPGDPYSKFVIIREEDRKKVVDRYNTWNTEYVMKGIGPSELLLVTTRDVAFKVDSEAIKQVWKVHNEADSSTFWRRNLYPRRSRFLVYDIQKKGKMYEERDSFRFWIALLTLALNTVDSDSLRPQKLYRLDIRMNKGKLSEVFQDTVNELNLADAKLRRSIEITDAKDITDEIPKYLLEVPVDFQHVRTAKTGDSSFAVHLTGGVTSDEDEQWEKYTVETYQKTAEMIKDVERELEMSAMSFKDRCRYEDSEVELLSKYAEEDFHYSLHETYNEVLKAQKQLPKGIVSYREELREADRVVKRDITERMSATQVSTVLGLAVIAFLLILLPALRQDSSQNEAIIVSAVSVLAILGIGLLVVFLQKRRFKKHVKEFKDYYNKMCAELNSSSALYKRFIGQIASHIHGSSYAKSLGRKKQAAAEAVGTKKMHIGFIEEFKNRLSLWSSALRLKVDYESLDEVTLFDDYSEIDFYHLYSLSLGDRYKSIPLNDTGYSVQTPFIFAEQLQIEREEVYDDHG